VVGNGRNHRILKEHMNDNQQQLVAQAYEVNGELMSQEQYEALRADQLNTLHQIFSKQRDEWVQARAQSGVENRWRMAQSMYFGDESTGDSEFVDALKNGQRARGSKVGANRSKVVINIVRPKVDQAVARMCEILLPVDDRNWGIKPTPVPEAVSAMLGSQAPMLHPQTGQPTGQTEDQVAQDITKRVKQCSEKMQAEIDDVLTQCQYNGEQRKMLEDAVRLGTGFMLGPYPVNGGKRSWRPSEDGTLQLVMTNEVVPASMRADPWDIFTDPACGNDHQRGLGFFHRRFATRKELRALVGLPGYDEDCIREVLRNKPTRTQVAGGRVTRELADDDSYEMWVFYGQVEPDQMEMLSESMGDPLVDVQDGVIIMIGEKIIGAMESWIPDGSMPLDSWCWRKADNSPYGYGLPDELGHQQRVVNAAWRQVMDDAKFSIGGQLVMKKKMIIPQDGSYEMSPGKVWLASEDLDDVRQAMHMFEFASHAPQLLSIATAAMQFADQETSMPQMLGGDKGGTAPETLGGMVMLSNNSNTVLRLRVKLYDDSLTRPHIRRYYDWMMAQSKKPEIKGDMEVDARGSTALLEKDIQNQATINLANVTSNPRYQAFLDPKEELKVILKAFKVNPDDIMLSNDKIEQNLQAAQQNPPPQDPRVQAAQMAMQVKQLELQDRQAQRQVDLQLAQGDQQIKREGIAYTSERERADAEQVSVRLQVERELAIAQMQADGVESQAERESKARLQAIDLSNKNALFSAEAAIKVRQGSGI
jgi:hypothetical protein